MLQPDGTFLVLDAALQTVHDPELHRDIVSLNMVQDLAVEGGVPWRSEPARRAGTVHVGGMDLIGPALKIHGESLHVVADDTTYGRLYDHLAAVRARQHIFLIGWRNLRGLFRALRDRENLVLFCDGGTDAQARPDDWPAPLPKA